MTLGRSTLTEQAAFLEERRTDRGDQEYRFLPNAYSQQKSFVMRKFSTMLGGDTRRFHKYVAANEASTEYRLKAAYVLEAFGLGTYELTGGRLSRILVRFNDPYRLLRYADDERYTNALITDVQRRHERAMQQMEEFFGREMSNTERWDYIEQYFLGRIGEG